MTRNNGVTIGSYLAMLVVMIDQASKEWVLRVVSELGSPFEVTSFLNVRLSWNKGVTFGMFSDVGPWMPYILIGLAVVILGFLFSWLWKAESLLTAIGLGSIMGGAVGNVLDRLRFGSVIDFIDVHALGYHWYTFNFADSAIVFGVGLLLLENFRLKRQ